MPFKTVDSAVRGMAWVLYLVASTYGDGRVIVLRRLPRRLVLSDGRTVSRKTIITYVSKLRRLCREGLVSPCPIRVSYDKGVVVEIDLPEQYVETRRPRRVSDAERHAVYEHRRKNRYKLRKILHRLVKSLDAVDALSYMVSRARYVDEPLFPVTITEVGLAGSAWRRPDPGDVDIVVSIRHNKIFKDYEEFQSLLDDRFPYIWNMLQEMRAKHYGIRMEFFIEKYREQLKELGLTDRHLDWLRYLRIKEFDKAAYMGVFSVDYRDIVLRFLRGG